MPVEAKPLFRPDVLQPYVKGFQLPETVNARRPNLEKWAVLLESGRADDFKEQELLADFLGDIFCGILGYCRPADSPERFTISREKHVQVDGKYADAVLGDFRPGKEQFIVALEGKGPRDPLDRPFGGRRMSAVDQGYRYAINLPCDWVIVTSIRQTRLYYKGADQQTYERFDTEALAANDALLRKFVFLLGAERVVPTVGKCHLHALRDASESAGRELTKKFYLRYADMRQDAFVRLCRRNPEVPPPDILAATQKILDRVLFCAFCEDRGLLPSDTITRAYEHRDPYHPRPIWNNFLGLFGAINRGNETLKIPAYNGGLFADDPLLARLVVPDEVCGYFRELGDYDYRPASEAAAESPAEFRTALVDVDILGHIFEQSITDLERLRDLIEGGLPDDLEKHKSRRKKEGAFYTPAFITRYIVDQTLGGVLSDRFEALRAAHAAAAKGTARSVLEDPAVYDLAKLNKPRRDALVRFWEAWQDELATIRLLDPACGSGAFLIEAFDQLHAAYEASNERLEELRGHRTLFDLDRQILQKNLYGVDLNSEAIEICRLSLWIKTAQRGKILTSLDETIRVGNSVVDDPAYDPRAFNWKGVFPEVFKDGGFDVVLANPPYVRQELLSPIKPYLEGHYRAYHGMADLYVYFYELGLRLLKPGGRLSFIVTNKWMKAGYGEPLRRLFADAAWVDSVVDFGHAKQIFEDADVFPSILALRKPDGETRPSETRVCAIPREQLRIDDLAEQIETEGFGVDAAELGSEPWQLEPQGVVELMAKIRDRGVPLTEYSGTKPYRGILTGFNQAFLIDSATRKQLIEEDGNCEELIRPYVRGQDLGRWAANWAGLWMITVKSSDNYTWPWSEDPEGAEDLFRGSYPSLHEHFKQYEPRLRKRQDKGRFWWELRSCKYWDDFLGPKIMYQEIQYHPSYALDTEEYLGNNKLFFVAYADLFLLGVLNSALMWWHNWRYLPHMKDEALSPVGFRMELLPIVRPRDDVREVVECSVTRRIALASESQNAQCMILDWLRVEYDINKPSKRLQSPLELDGDALVAEVRKARGKKNPLSAAGLKNLRDEHARTIAPAQALAREAAELEKKISDLVNAAYGLTPEEIDLMWKTAPPRMPIG